MTPRSFSTWSHTKLDEATRFITNCDQIIHEAMSQAFGPPGTSGDAEAILYCAKRLAEVYKNAMEWKLDFARARVAPDLDGLKAATARFCDNMVQEIEEFSLKLNRELKQAVADAQSGKKVELSIMLTLTSPGTGELEKEMERLRALIASGRLAWD